MSEGRIREAGCAGTDVGALDAGWDPSGERQAWARFVDEGTMDALNDLLAVWRHVGREDRVRWLLEMLIHGECGADLERRALLQVYLGQSYERTGDYDAAEAEYRQALALEPADPWVQYFTHNNLGYCLNVRGRYKEGERVCRIATTVNPRRANAWKNLGISLQGLGRLPEAFYAWVQATRVNPTDSRAHSLLQRLVEDHPALLERLVEDHPELLERPDARADLERCRSAVATARELYGSAG